MKMFRFLFVLFIPGVIIPQGKTALKTDIDLLLRDNFFNSATAAIDIYDLTANEIIYRKNEKLLLRPASNLKLVTSAAALVFLEPDYKFITSVYYTGEIKDSICFGDIYFVGGCDPDFTLPDLEFVVNEIKLFGIKEIKGNIYGDVTMLDSLFWGTGWMWDDELSSDFPYFTPLIINDACVKIEYSPANIGDKVNVNIIPSSNFFNITNTSKTILTDSSDFRIRRDWVNRSNNIFVSGNLFYQNIVDTITTNIVYPELFFLNLAEQSIKNSGIVFNGQLEILPLPENSKKIFYFERKFKDVINNLNKESDNLSAEMTLRAIAYKYFGKPTTAENGIKLIDSLLTEIGLTKSDYRIVDGSGVSHYNLISAELLTQLLKHIYREYPDLFKMLYNSLPIAGVDGTLKNRMKSGFAFNNVRAKTGTLSGVSSLSGYLTTKNNHEIAFSILVQNFKGSSKAARIFQEKICELLSEYN